MKRNAFGVSHTFEEFEGCGVCVCRGGVESMRDPKGLAESFPFKNWIINKVAPVKVKSLY